MVGCHGRLARPCPRGSTAGQADRGTRIRVSRRQLEHHARLRFLV